jgi:hypothetical protein
VGEVGGGCAEMGQQRTGEIEATRGHAERPPADRVVGGRRDARARYVVPELAMRWDKLEHALLDAGDSPSEAILQQASSTEVRDSLLRIAAYLKDTCGIAVDSS